jgi:hypothetical protein
MKIQGVPLLQPDVIFPCSRCFAGQTPITMAGGSVKRIDQIAAGDVVMSYDEQCSEYVTNKIVTLLTGKSSHLCRLVPTDGYNYTHVTQDHQFLTTKGWKKAEDLSGRDHVLSKNGLVRMRHVLPWIPNKVMTVFDLEVEHSHTYLVNSMVVHDATVGMERQPEGVTP